MNPWEGDRSRQHITLREISFADAYVSAVATPLAPPLVAGSSFQPVDETFRLRTPLRSRYAGIRCKGWAIWYITAVCLACYLIISLSAYSQFISNGYDLGIFDQAVRAYAHFQAPLSAIKAPGYDIMGDHFSPIVALCAPLYWVWDNPCMLLIAQAVLLAWSVPVVHRFAGRRMDRRFALFFATIYGLGWPIFNLANFDFHELAFAVPFLSAALDALDRGAFRSLFVWAGLLLVVKEDMGLVVSALSIIVVVIDRRRSNSGQQAMRRAMVLGGVLFLAGVSAYELVTRVAIPALAPNHFFAYWQYGAIGNSLPAAAINIVTQPLHALNVFFTPFPKSFTMGMLFAPYLLLSLRSPYILAAIPLLAERFFNSREELWTPHFHYSALPWLVISLAAIDAYGRRTTFRRAAARAKLAVAAIITTSLFASTIAAYIEAASETNAFVIGRLLNWNNRDVVGRQTAVGLVPDLVCVEADNNLLPHLSRRDFATLPGAKGIRPDFILLDLEHQYVGPSQGTPGASGESTIFALAQARAEGYTVYRLSGPVVILRSSNYEGPSPDCGPLASGHRSKPMDG